MQIYLDMSGYMIMYICAYRCIYVFFVGSLVTHNKQMNTCTNINRKYMKLMIVSILRNAGMNSGQLGTIIDAISDTAASTDDVRMTL